MYPKDIIERIKLPFRKDKELYSSFYKILGFYPHHIQYYEQALHHKSSSIKKQGSWINNERLEFLGDAILDAVVGDIVFRHFKGKREGFLTNTRSKIVQRETLNRLAVEIGLDKLIISSTHSSTHNKRIMTQLINIDKLAYKEVNFKSKLIEWGQKRRVEIIFDLIDEAREGSSTPVFTTQITIEGVTCCKGRGYSKKESQQLAAKDTLALLRKSPKLVERILSNKRQKEALSEMSIQDNEQQTITVVASPKLQVSVTESPEFSMVGRR